MNLGKLQEMVKDRETWRATVCGVTKSQTWLGEWTITNFCIPLILAHVTKPLKASPDSPFLHSSLWLFLNIYWSSTVIPFIHLFLSMYNEHTWKLIKRINHIFSILTKLCNHHCYIIPGHFKQPREKSQSH